MATNDKLFSIEELDRWATAPAPKELHYFAREDFQAICKHAADTMRELEAAKSDIEMLYNSREKYVRENDRLRGWVIEFRTSDIANEYDLYDEIDEALSNKESDNG